ncbi:MAG TPA: carbohydrate porin, partial [Burkholderiales bacterium]|nr:carbohydrate porin [Burkholderiales bacterium]
VKKMRKTTEQYLYTALVAVMLLTIVMVANAYAEGPEVPQFLGAQYTLIAQHLFPFEAAYSGPNSLRNDGDTQKTQTFGLYSGMKVWNHLQAYLDFELFKGAAVSNATGLGGLTNGDVLRQGSFNIGKRPYVARAFLRYFWPMGDEMIDPAVRAMDQLPGVEPAKRIEVKLGKFAANDDFDRNRYANSTRTQFENWSLWNNTAWDYAADTRGYTNGVMVGYVSPIWALRLGIYQMPTVANGPDLDQPLTKSRGENLELTLQPNHYGTAVRLLAYRNVANMGIYRDAIAIGLAQGAVPNVAADDQPGRKKYGFGLNLEQPLADGGETGLFARLGWDDGKTESFAFAEVDRTVTFGAQVAGNHWRRSADRLGIALAVNGLSADHRHYLAAGGSGFVLGDGRLNYGYEKIVEAYYRIQLGKYAQLSPDFQYIDNPGYNRDRGPATVVAIRLHIEY